MTIMLRQYQQDGVDRVRSAMRQGKRRVIMCAPTGAGKTVMFSYIAKSVLEKGKRAIIVTDRTVLLTQTGGALYEFGMNPEVIRAGKMRVSSDAQLYISMVETLHRRLTGRNAEGYREILRSMDLVVFDEAHKQAFTKIIELLHPQTFVIGATATPYRAPSMRQLKEDYNEIVDVVSIAELVKQGFLANPRHYMHEVDLSSVKMKKGDYDEKGVAEEFDNQRVYEGVVDNYRKHAHGTKTLLFASTIESSKKVCEELRSAGYDARHFDCYMPEEEKKEVLAWFDKSRDGILCNVGILTTGFDQPDIDTIILYRATKSLPLFLQMCGRGSRMANGKKEFKIMDFGNNIGEHGFWHEPREWSLYTPPKSPGVQPMKECPACESIIPANCRECEFCGHVFEKKEIEQEIEKAKLREAEEDDEIAMMKFKTFCNRIWKLLQEGETDEIKRHFDVKGYKTKGVMAHQVLPRVLDTENYEERKRLLKKYAETVGYKQAWVYVQLKNNEHAET